MYLDVIDMKTFYERPLGRVVRQTVGARIRNIWPDARGERILGLGYATPYLRPYLGTAERVMAGMPGPQGVVSWPPEGPNRAMLCLEHDLPLPDASVDRVLIVHGLDMSGDSQGALREVWRVLAPGGRLMVVVPNRRSLWSQLEYSPFGYGRPYSRGQLSALLRETRFAPKTREGALFLPPFRRRLFLRSARTWERVGARLWPAFAGVWIVEAEKQLYQSISTAEKKHASRIFRPVFATDGTPRESF
ncbi:class I SAM-dependent methyltransferase [Breoghania sp. L-A4]|uniref:class I SAM-dependent methyltransferase n=1 Tax=Breoghania sp. L-A4 TaxID=2304600 RepID=UPI000E35E68A|nr:class I SAM-dependent methyltransferase [Breoghania sp. L-A4]AXS38845.1 class I SAM-dependent methyltransferase [Breoghania sp. L-A4]